MLPPERIDFSYITIATFQCSISIIISNVHAEADFTFITDPGIRHHFINTHRPNTEGALMLNLSDVNKQ